MRLVLTRNDRQRYIEALEIADKGDLTLLIKIFVKSQLRQFRKASEVGKETYSTIQGTQSALKVLQTAARVHQNRAMSKLLRHAEAIKKDLKKRLEELCPDIENALKKVHLSSRVTIEESIEETDYYFGSQIIETAKRLEYFLQIGLLISRGFPYRCTGLAGQGLSSAFTALDLA